MRDGFKCDSDLHRRRRRDIFGHEPALNLAGNFHFPVHAAFVLGDLGVKLRVDQRARDARCQSHEQALVVLAEIVERRAFQIDNSDHASFVN